MTVIVALCWDYSSVTLHFSPALLNLLIMTKVYSEG